MVNFIYCSCLTSCLLPVLLSSMQIIRRPQKASSTPPLILSCMCFSLRVNFWSYLEAWQLAFASSNMLASFCLIRYAADELDRPAVPSPLLTALTSDSTNGGIAPDFSPSTSASWWILSNSAGVGSWWLNFRDILGRLVQWFPQIFMFKARQIGFWSSLFRTASSLIVAMESIRCGTRLGILYDPRWSPHLFARFIYSLAWASIRASFSAVHWGLKWIWKEGSVSYRTIWILTRFSVLLW